MKRCDATSIINSLSKPNGNVVIISHCCVYTQILMIKLSLYINILMAIFQRILGP